MLRLWKLWSEEGKFKELAFKPGINLIIGDKSIGEHGEVITEKRNGAGKSLSIELINFCFLKTASNSRIREIPEENLPSESFIYLRFELDKKFYVIGRNKKDEIKFLDEENGSWKEMDLTVARKELERIFNLKKELSARAFLNFIIKESTYNYTHFLSLFHSTHLDALKPSLYFFNLPIEIFTEINDLQEEFDLLEGQIRAAEKKLIAKGLDEPKLRSYQIQLESEVSKMKGVLDYNAISEQVATQSFEIKKEEAALQELKDKKRSSKILLFEIEEFLRNFNEDLNIPDRELKTLFDNYKEGLGDFIQKDFNALKVFRKQLFEFKEDLLMIRIEKLKHEIEVLDSQIREQEGKIGKFSFIFKEGQNVLQKNMQIFQEKNNEFDENKKILLDFDRFEDESGNLNSRFYSLYEKLNLRRLELRDIERSFLKTFTLIYQYIYGDTDCSFRFNFPINGNIKTKKLFNIEAHIDKEGSEGRNRARAIIYDFSLLTNEITIKKMKGLLIHDRLLFGDIDKETTVKILNFLSGLDEENYQYIATMNTDDVTDYVESNTNFNIFDKAAIKLTIEEPLFYKQFKAKYIS